MRNNEQRANADVLDYDVACTGYLEAFAFTVNTISENVEEGYAGGTNIPALLPFPRRVLLLPTLSGVRPAV